MDEVFQLLDERATEYDYTITVSVAEIYNNRIRDLLGDDFEAAHEVIVGTSGDADVPTLRLVCFTMHIRRQQAPRLLPLNA